MNRMPRWLPFAMILPALVPIFFGWMRLRRCIEANRLADAHLVAKARVESVVPTGKGQRFVVDFLVTAKDGRQYRVSSTFATEYDMGDQVEVLFDPKHPKDVYDMDDTEVDALTIELFAFGGFIILIALIALVRPNRWARW